jgi:hypothetical protein
MNQRDAKRLGRETGNNIASWIDIPEIGAIIRTESDGKQTVTEDNVWDIMESLAYESESNGRQFSPFEHTAHAFNEARNPDALWEAYEAGLALGIRTNISKRQKLYSR